jgi:GNAT superfamily N-acetyltransferase
MSIDVFSARGRRELQHFIDLPHAIYRGDTHYVPQLSVQQRELLGAASPFRRHAELELFLAWRDGRPVGRVAAIHNRLYDEHHRARQGWFGFFDCEDDQEVCDRLLEACRTWLAARSLTGMRGPVNPDLNHGCGVLSKGFDRPPAVFMPYNGPWYGRLLEAAGLRSVKRLNAWEIASARIPELAFRYADRLRHRLQECGVVLRPIAMHDFAGEIARLRTVYNDALAGTWGHTPLTEEEFREQARGLKHICPPEFIQIAELEGRIVGFIGAAPDLNEILRHLDRGRLLPWGWMRLLAGRRHIRWGRIVMYGVAPRHRGTGLAAWLYTAIIRALRERGYKGAEASYVLDDNRPVNKLSAKLGGILTKQYTIYDLPSVQGNGDECGR